MIYLQIQNFLSPLRPALFPALLHGTPAKFLNSVWFAETRILELPFGKNRGGTAAAAPPPLRPSDPALCGSCPLVTPYYCRLGDLLCYSCLLYLSTFCVCMHMCNFCFLCVFCVIFLYSFLLQYFDTVGWVFWPVKIVSHITYTVLEGT